MLFCGWMNVALTLFFFYCSPIFDLSLKMGVGFLSTHYSDLSFLLLVEAEEFYVPLLSGVQKPYRLLDWSPVQPTVTCHDSNRIILCLFVSMAGRYRWCCQEAAYTIRHSVMQSLHFSSSAALSCNFLPRVSCLTFTMKESHIDSGSFMHWRYIEAGVPNRCWCLIASSCLISGAQLPVP